MALREIFKNIKITFWDLAIMVAVLIFAVALFGISISSLGDKPSSCVIEIDGEEFARYDLYSLTQPKTIEIDNQYGKNIVVIDNKGASVVFTDCPDGFEVKEGKITLPGQSLICLPHRLCIRLEGESGNNAVSW